MYQDKCATTTTQGLTRNPIITVAGFDMGAGAVLITKPSMWEKKWMLRKYRF